MVPINLLYTRSIIGKIQKYTRQSDSIKSSTASVQNDDASGEATGSEHSAASTAPVRGHSTVSESTIGGSIAEECRVEEEPIEEDEGLKAEEDIIKQRAETIFRKQEEEWLTKREKVSRGC